MKRFLFVLISSAMLAGVAAAAPSPLAKRPAGIAADVLAHGGGCRKDSPPGRCCHMDNRTGVVHCH